MLNLLFCVPHKNHALKLFLRLPQLNSLVALAYDVAPRSNETPGGRVGTNGSTAAHDGQSWEGSSRDCNTNLMWAK